MITLPPSPPKIPNTNDKCQSFYSSNAEIINNKGNVGNIKTRSDCLIRYASILPPKYAAIVPSNVEIPTPTIALNNPRTKAT